MMRKIMCRKEMSQEDREKLLTPLGDPNSSFFKLFGHASNSKKLAPEKLNHTTYLEIFNSKKKSLKKNLNYINYTKHDHDVITNQRLSSAYTSFRSDLFKYETEKPDPKNFKKRLFLNRSPPGENTPKKHIMRNIRHIKNLSDLNKLRNLDDSVDKKQFNMTTTHRKDRSHFVIFKRRGTTGSRRFNETNYNTIHKKRASLFANNKFGKDLTGEKYERKHPTPNYASKLRLRSAAHRKSFGVTSKIEGKERQEIEFTEDENKLFGLLEEKIKQVSEGDEEAEQKALKRLEYLKKFFKLENKQILIHTKIKMIRELAPLILAKREGINSSKTGLLNKRPESKIIQEMSKDKVNEDLLAELEDDNLEEIDDILNAIIGVKKPKDLEKEQKANQRGKSNHSQREGSTLSKLEKLESQIDKERKLRKKQEQEILKLRKRLVGINKNK